MADVTTSPIAVAYRDESVLNAGISASATTITVAPFYKYPNGVKTQQGFDTTAGYAEISLGKRTEVISFGAKSVDGTTKVTTLTDVRRGLPQTNTTANFAAGTGLPWNKGAKIRVIDFSNYIHQTPFVDKANTFTANQLLSSTNELRFADSATAIWDDGSDLNFKSSAQATRTLSQLASLSGSNDKVKVTSNDTTEDYLFNQLAAGSGITVSETNDGSNESVTIAAVNTVATGHTGLSTVTSGGLLVGAGTSNMTIIGPGTSKQVPVSNGTTIAMGTVPAFVKPVYMSTTNSATLSNPTSATAFDTHSYTIPADDLINGVEYEWQATVTSVHGTGTNGNFHVSLGAANRLSIAIGTPSGAGTYIMVLHGRIKGTAASGASVAVEFNGSGILGDGVNGGAGADSSSANLATNGTLALAFGYHFGTTAAGNAATLTDVSIIKHSTSAFS